jgi:hypothetical protein
VITYPFLVFAFRCTNHLPDRLRYRSLADTTYAPLASLTAYPVWVVSLAGAVLGALAGGGSLWLVGAIWKKLRGVEAMGLGRREDDVGRRCVAWLAAGFLIYFSRGIRRGGHRDIRNIAAKG